MRQIFCISLIVLLLNGCGGTPGVDGVETLYTQAKDMQSLYNMNSTQASDLQNQVNLLIAQLGKMVGLPPTSLYSTGNPNKAYAISSALASAATMLAGGNSVPVVNNDVMNSMRVQILGMTSTMPNNYAMQNAWNMMQFDIIGELISLQASYLSLIPQYMLQLLPYMSKKRMQALQSTLQTVTSQLQQAMATT